MYRQDHGFSVVERMVRPRRWLAIACVLAFLVSMPAVSAARDRTPPSFSYTNVGPALVGPGGYLGFSAYVSDNVAVASVVGTVAGPLPSTSVVGTVTLDLLGGVWNGTFQFPFTASTGNYSTSMTAVDTSGNSATVAANPVSVDADPPRLVFPPDLRPRYVGSAGIVTLTVTLADNTGVAYAWGTVFGPNDPTAFFGYISLYEYYGTPQYGNWTGGFPFLDRAADGDYYVIVNASDSVWNTMIAPAGLVTLDRTAPDTTILSAVDGNGKPVPDGGRTRSNAISFAFAGTDANGVAGFSCSLDFGAFSPCWSGISYSGLSRGQHTFQVAAVDLAGNVDSTPATFVWIVRH